jgi:hypothetical protein
VIPGQRRRPGNSERDAGRGRADVSVLWHGDELGPRAVMDGRVGVRHEAEHLITDGIPGHLGADALHDAGVVAPQRDRKCVLDHAAEHPRGDRVVDRVGRRGVDPDEHLARAGGRGRKIVAHRRRRSECVDGDGPHR